MLMRITILLCSVLVNSVCHSADFTVQAIGNFILMGDLANTKLLVDNNPKIRPYMNRSESDILHLAIQSGNPEIVAYVLSLPWVEKKSEKILQSLVDVIDPDDMAVEEYRRQFEHKTEPGFIDPEMISLLCAHNNEQCVRQVLANYALKHGSTEAMATLIRHGLDCSSLRQRRSSTHEHMEKFLAQQNDAVNSDESAQCVTEIFEKEEKRRKKK